MVMRTLACFLIGGTTLLADPGATPAARQNPTTAPAAARTPAGRQTPPVEPDAAPEVEPVAELDSITQVLNAEVSSLLAADKHEEARVLIERAEADLAAHAAANKLPLWDASVARLFQIAETRRLALDRRSGSDGAPGAAPPPLKLAPEQVRQLSEIRRNLSAAETLVKRGKVVEGEAGADKVMADLNQLTRGANVPVWHRAVAPTFQAAGAILASRDARSQSGGRPGALNLHGPTAPPFTASTLDGKLLSSKQFSGKWVLLQFWATWCGPCRREMPNLKDVHATFGSDQRLAIISLSIDTDARRPRDFIAQEKLDWTHGLLQGAWDAAPVKAYGVRGIPAIFLISPEGRIAASGLWGEATKAAVTEALARK